jgi:hypothetical protein
MSLRTFTLSPECGTRQRSRWRLGDPGGQAKGAIDASPSSLQR